jgi:hypothetical protein
MYDCARSAAIPSFRHHTVGRKSCRKLIPHGSAARALNSPPKNSILPITIGYFASILHIIHHMDTNYVQNVEMASDSQQEKEELLRQVEALKVEQAKNYVEQAKYYVKLLVYAWKHRINELANLANLVEANGNRNSYSTSQKSGQSAGTPQKCPPNKKQKTDEESWGEWNIDEHESDREDAARKLSGELKEILKQDMRREGSRQSSRTGTCSRAQAPAPVDSQATVASSLGSSQTESQESEYEQRGERNSTMATEFVDKTVEDALMFLWRKRNGSLDEKKHTHVVVNKMLSAALSTLRNLAEQHKANFSPLQSMQETIELCLYKETEHSKEKVDRLSDAALYLGGKAMPDDKKNKFTGDVAKLGMLISFEHKTNILNKCLLRDAQKEACRDFAAKIDRFDLLDSPVGYSVLTDGITWIFLRLQLVLEKQHGTDEKKIVISTERSPDISIMKESSGHFAFEFDMLAKWLCFVLEESILKQTMKPQEPFLDDKAQNIQLSDESSFRISKVFDQGRFFVVRGKYEMNGQSQSSSVVLKITTDVSKKGETRLRKEQDNLTRFAESDAIVHMVPPNPTTQSYLSKFFLTIENAGIALDKLIVSGDAGKKLAEVVKRDIWGKALGVFRNQDYVHTDIHPGNICIQKSAEGKDMRATIVDLESAVKVDKIVNDSPIKDRDDIGIDKDATASFHMDEAAVLAILSCLHDDGSFRDWVDKRKKYFEMMWKGDRRYSE